MSRLICLLLSSVWATSVVSADVPQPPDDKAVTTLQSNVPDSEQLEFELQHMSWEKFRSVIEAIPKLKADVEAYGPAGWKYVELRYKTFRWKKSIDKLDDGQKQLLTDLIKRTSSTK